jgi:hypothetical protein
VTAGYAMLIEGLCDLGEGRIAAMDAAGIHVQVSTPSGHSAHRP